MNGCQYLLGACFKNIFSLFIKKINIFSGNPGLGVNLSIFNGPSFSGIFWSWYWMNLSACSEHIYGSKLGQSGSLMTESGMDMNRESLQNSTTGQPWIAMVQGDDHPVMSQTLGVQQQDFAPDLRLAMDKQSKASSGKTLQGALSLDVSCSLGVIKCSNGKSSSMENICLRKSSTHIIDARSGYQRFRCKLGPLNVITWFTLAP